MKVKIKLILVQNVGWIVGDNGTIIKMIEDGRKLLKVGAPLQNNFTDIFFLNLNTGWVISSTHTLRTQDGGTSWEVFSAPYLRRAKFFDQETGWGHAYGATLLKTTDGGRSWSPALQLASNFVVNHQIHDFLALSRNEVVVVGFGYDHHFDWGLIATTKDGGESWNIGWPGYWNYFTNVVRFGQDSLYIFASNRVIYRGDKKVGDNHPSFQKMSFVDSLHWWNATGSGEVHRTTNGGTTWQRLLPGVTYDMTTITFADRMQGWAAGTCGFMVHTTNGGQTWVLQRKGVSPCKENVVDLSFVSSLHGWALSNDQIPESPSILFRNKIHSTTDGGLTWEQAEVVSATRYFTLYFVDKQHGWLAGWYGSIRKSSDGGKTWTLQHQEDSSYTFPKLRWIKDIYFVDQFSGWAVGESGRIMRTNDGGQTWHTQFLDSAYNFVRVKFFDKQRGWIFASRPTWYLLKTSDGGNSWQADSLPCNWYSGADVLLTSWEKGILRVNEKLYLSRDGGQTWTFFSSIPSYGGNRPIRAMASSDENTFWFVGDKEWILRLDLSVTSVDTPNSPFLPDAYQLFQNYPNPFNPTTVISFELPVSSWVSLRIFNVLGQEVATLVNGKINAGKRQVKWDAEAFPSGIYFYQLQAGDFMQTRKLMLLR